MAVIIQELEDGSERLLTPESTEDKPAVLKGTKVDFGLIRELGDNEEDLFDPEKNLAQNLQTVITECVDVYDSSIQLPLITAFALLPSALISVAPVAIFHGASGSGKSVLTSIIGNLHDIPLLSSNSTYAAIRNALNSQRWVDTETQDHERHTFLLFDDCKEHSFNEDVFALFRCGYDRATEVIQISSERAGTNLTFRCFAPKVFSTVSGFPFDSRFEELIRRSFVFWCKRSDSPREYLDPSDLNWSGFQDAYKSQWDNPSNLGLYKEFTGFIKSLKTRPKGLTPSQWKVSKPILASLVFNEILDKHDGILLLREYWGKFKKPQSALNLLLSQKIKELQTEHDLSESAIGSPIPFEIDPLLISSAIKAARESGALNVIPNPYLVNEEMLSLGFSLQMNISGKVTWQITR